MRPRNLPLVCALLTLLAGSARFPREGPALGVDESAPQPSTYRYTCDFLIYDTYGTFRNKMKIQATQTRDLPDDRMRWNAASIAFGTTLEGEFTPPLPQTYVEDFSYSRPAIEDMLTAEFFESFPATPFGFLMKNSVLDAHVFDSFLDEFGSLELNVPHRSASSEAEILLYDEQGVQHLKNLTLILTGTSQRNGRKCAVIRYQSSLDAVAVDLPGFQMSGSTVFWGDLWVSADGQQVEFATLHEHSLMGPPDPGAPIQELQNTYRAATFERRSP